MGEKMSNAPVYFTIAQVRHNPLLLLDSYAADIQDRMRKAGYPDFQQGDVVAFTLSNPIEALQSQPKVERVKRLLFFNSERTKGFVVEMNALSFHTTEYESIDRLIDELLCGLAIIHDCVTLAHSERIGLRYLNAVAPSENENLNQYLDAGVLGIREKLIESTKPIDIPHTLTETFIKTEKCNVLSRTFIHTGSLAFPVDLQPGGINIAERFVSIDGLHAIVDIDASNEKRQPFDSNYQKYIDLTFKNLRKGIGAAFDAIVTEFALSKWK